MRSIERWQLVMERNPLADGQFVYAVRSTGVYCRPTCPSRRPNPKQVEFFSTPKEAEQAGYRSCRRCRPEGMPPQARVVTAVCDYLKTNLDRKVRLAELSAHVQMSSFHLQRLFKQQTGVSPREYQSTLRAAEVRRALPEASTVTESIYEAGYSSGSRFYESAGRDLGMSPSAWKKGGQGLTIRYTIFPSPLGNMVLAATEKGVCFLGMGKHGRKLESELRAQFPAAMLVDDDASLSVYKDVVFDYLSGARPHPDLPLDVKATAFQGLVWQKLRQIPPGTTKSYSSIAAELGDENAVRAVARACATNPVSLAIPCHRVVRTRGELAGYRWGIGRKQHLLEMEKRAE